MPALLLHLLAVERLAADAERLPNAFLHALGKDLEYARFGAALLDLPYLGGVFGALGPFHAHRVPPPWAHRLHAHRPVTFGLKVAELVAGGALVGGDAGRALLAGYFTHVAMDRLMHPYLQARVCELRRRGEPELVTRQRIEWAQTLLYLGARHPKSRLGTPALEAHLRVSKHAGYPFRGVGGGFYELLRLGALEACGEAPSKDELDDWVRGLYLHGRLLASPLGKLRARPGRDVPSDGRVLELVDAALTLTRTLLRELDGYMNRSRFGRRARARFLLHLPDEPLGAYPPLIRAPSELTRRVP